MTTSSGDDQAKSGDGQAKHYRLPVGTMGAAIAVTVLVIALLTWQLWSVSDEYQTASDFNQEVTYAGEQALFYNERLVMSTHMAAATGADRWVDRHGATLREIEAALNRLQELAPDHLVEQFERETVEQNNILVELEERIFDHVAAGDYAAATEILEGAEYTQAERNLTEGLERFVAAMNDIVAQEQAEIDAGATRALWLAFAGGLVLAGTWAWLTRILVAWRNGLVRAEEERRGHEEARRVEEQRKREEQEERERREAQRAANLREIATDLDDNTRRSLETVTSSISQLNIHAETMSDLARTTRDKVQTIASSAQQTTANVQAVASASQQMTQSIQEVAQRVNEASDRAQSARQEAASANERMQALRDAAQQIGSVIQQIDEIAEKTNLLALNATIEAARAGDAGKGFAVVANEVKSLASQTQKATADISERIHRVQSETQDAVEAIGVIAESIKEIDGTASSVASAMEEQSSSTQEIARNIEEASKGVQLVSGTLEDVSQVADQTEQSASQVRDTAQNNGEEAANLQQTIIGYLDKLRSA